MARSRTFTVAEAEGYIPALERIFTQAIQLRGALRTREQELDRLGVQITREVLAGHNAGDPIAVRRAKAGFRGCYEALEEALAEVATIGAEVKDLEVGLVDFPGRRGSEDILLCWKLGEKRIGHWHRLEGGFSTRRPIDEKVSREPRRLD